MSFNESGCVSVFWCHDEYKNMFIRYVVICKCRKQNDRMGFLEFSKYT
jgi:hypothetical protein